MWFTSEIQKLLHAAFSHLHLLESNRFVPSLCHERKIKTGSTCSVDAPCECLLYVCVFVCADTLSTAALVVWVQVPGFSLHIWASSAQTDKDWKEIRTSSY